MRVIEGMKPYAPPTYPVQGQVIDLKSTEGDRVWANCEVIGVGESSRGMALWVWIDGTEVGIKGRIHTYMPIKEIEGWQPA